VRRRRSIFNRAHEVRAVVVTTAAAALTIAVLSSTDTDVPPPPSRIQISLLVAVVRSTSLSMRWAGETTGFAPGESSCPGLCRCVSNPADSPHVVVGI